MDKAAGTMIVTWGSVVDGEAAADSAAVVGLSASEQFRSLCLSRVSRAVVEIYWFL